MFSPTETTTVSGDVYKRQVRCQGLSQFDSVYVPEVIPKTLNPHLSAIPVYYITESGKIASNFEEMIETALRFLLDPVGINIPISLDQ